MRRIAALVLALAFVPVVGMASPTAPADSPDLAGAWKLVLVVYGNDEFAIFDVKAADGKVAGTVISAQPMLGELKSVEGTIQDDKVAITLPGQGDPMVFNGTLDKAGKKATGSFKFRGSSYPAQIEKTESKAVAKLVNSPLQQKLAQLQTVKDPKDRLAKTLELIRENPGHPMNATAYAQLLSQAEGAGLGLEEVRELTRKWIDEAKPYGTEWSADVQTRALKALQGMKAYASLATEIGQAADRELPADAPLDTRGKVATMIARSARLAGKDAIANEAESRAKEIDVKLDAEYHEKVPPFKPEAFAGRSSGKGNRVVLMEIFTGAECPPCVAADVAFDGLLTTYKPTEFIGLQYHLHIPGPDPLTNLATVARQGYYGTEVRGTPSTFFNGKSLAGGGGSMAGSEGKYKEFRKIIEPALESEKSADIELTATRSGDEIKIAAKAKATGDPAKAAKAKLRLVLVEESVRYPGSNKLRFHHNVVRAFPGGVDGKLLEKGEGVVEATLKLSDLRKEQDAYLAQYPTSPRGRAFPNALPPMDLDTLAVVALVQDETDHTVWHAVQVPVKAATP